MMREWIVVPVMIMALGGCGKSEEPAKPAETAPSQVAAAPKYDIPSDAGEMKPGVISGDWNVGAEVAKVLVEGDALVCDNEKGLRSKCAIEEDKVLVAADWRVHAFLLGGGKVLKWSDGSAWGR